MKTSWHVATAAEAMAAAQFARSGWDISVQYGANHPCYDLIASTDHCMLKVSVKGSKDGGWGLTQSYLTKGKADYHAAVDKWLAKHSPQIIVCLVQFDGVALEQMPDIWLATPTEIATHLKAARGGSGDTVLNVCYTWGSRSKCAGIKDAIPDSWRFTESRLAELAATRGIPQK